MPGTTNPVGTWLNDPDFEAQLGTSYKTALDNALTVARRLVRAFAPHEQSTPNMTVRLDEGFIFSGGTLSEVAAQSTGTITAPVTNPRIDRVVVDNATGAVSVITGTEAASPSAPAITAGKTPVAQVLLQTSTTQITNAIITDERVTAAGLSAAVAEVITAAWTLANPTITGAAPATPVADRLYANSLVCAWAIVDVTAGAPSLVADFNVSGVVDTGTGQVTVTVDTDFGGADTYVAIPSIRGGVEPNRHVRIGEQLAGSFRVDSLRTSDQTLQDLGSGDDIVVICAGT
jgi:hypothetical protein